MWRDVLGMLRVDEAVGNQLQLCCPRHTETPILVSEALDFEKYSPEGGCHRPCNRRLPNCGHMCLSPCHSDSMHEVLKCPQPCQRLLAPCNHNCQKATCGEECGLCLIRLDDILLPCKHVKNGVACYRTQNLASIWCKVPVTKKIISCGHDVVVTCSTNLAQYTCPTPCSKILECGHNCPGTCGTCKMPDGKTEVVHQKCNVVCGRPFGSCHHICRRKCHGGTDCGVCQQTCEVSSIQIINLIHADDLDSMLPFSLWPQVL
jgi:hypothetical protein